MPSPRQISGNLPSSNLAQNLSDRQLDTTMNKKQEKVKVYVRLRPFLEEEYNQNKQCSIESFDTKNKIIAIKRDYEKKVFNFDGIFEPKVNQKEIYNQVASPVIQSVLEGFNGTIFAYGQTGTGKTFTMLGGSKEADKGIIPRALQDIFTKVEEDTSHVYSIQLSCIQIYMEMLQDLINPENQIIRIRESPENGVFVSGIEWVIIQNPSEALQLLEFAEKNRAVAFTALNACSSRSHVILMVQVQKRSKKVIEEQSKCNSLNNSLVQYNTNSFIHNEENDNNNSNNNLGVSLVTSILYLVDLAGSERVKKSKSTGDRLHEAKAINSSLSALGKCISALSDGKSNFIPFRESKLTRLLQDSLGGNSKTSLVVTVGPSIKHTDETISSLGFGQRAMKVTNKPIVNKQKDYYLLSMQLQQELDGKDDQIHQLEIAQQSMMKQIVGLQADLNRIKLDKQELEGSSRHLKMSLCQGVKQQDAVLLLEQQKIIEVENIETKYKELLKKTEEDQKSFLEEIEKTLVEYEEEIDLLKLDNTKYLADIQNYVQQIETFNDQLKAKNEEITNLENTYKVLESEKDSSEQQFIELSQQFKLLDAGYKERDENNKKQIKLGEQKINQQDKEITDLKEVIVSLQNGQSDELQSLQEEIQQLKQKNEELQEELNQKIDCITQKETQHQQELDIVKNEYSSQFEYLNTERENLKKSLEKDRADLELELKQTQELIEKQKVEIIEYEKVISESNEEKSLMMQQLEIKIDELIQHNKREVASMKKQINEKDLFIQNQKNSYEQLLNKMNELQEDYEENQEQLTELQEQQEKNQSQIQEKEIQVSEMKQLLEEQKIKQEQENDDYSIQIEQLNQKIQQQIEQKQQLETQFEMEIEQYKSKNQQDLDNLNIKFAQNHLQSEAIVKQLNQQIDQLNQNNSQKEQQLIKQLQQTQQLNEQIEKLNSEIQEQQDQLNTLQDNNKQLILQLDEAEKELLIQKQETFKEQQINAELKKEISILNQEIFDKKKEILQNSNQNLSLEQKIEQMTQEITVKELQLQNEKQENKEIMEECENQIKIKEAELLRVIEKQQSEKKEIELIKIELEQKMQDLLIVEENQEQIIAENQETIINLQKQLEEKKEKLKQVSLLSHEIEDALNHKQEYIQQLLTKNNEVEDKLTSLQNQILDLEDINKENIKKQEEILDEIEDSKKQILLLNQELIQQKQLKKQLEEENISQRIDIENYQVQITQMDELNQLNNDKLNSFAKQIEISEEEIKSHQQTNEEQASIFNKLNEQIIELTQQLESQQLQNQQLQEKVKEIQQKAQDYQKIIKEQNEEINITAESNIEMSNTLRQEVQRLSDEIQEYQQEITTLKEQLETQINLVTESENANQIQQLELEQKIAQMMEQENVVKQCQLKTQLSEERILILEQQLQSKQQVIEEQIDEIKRHKENVEQVLQSEIDDKQSIINEYQEKFIEQENLQKVLEDQIEQIINEYQVKLDQKVSEIEEIQEEFQSYKSESVEQFTLLQTQFEEQINKQEGEIEQLNEKIKTETKLKEEIQKQNEDLLQEINTIKQVSAERGEELEQKLIQEKGQLDLLNNQLIKNKQDFEELSIQHSQNQLISNQKIMQMQIDLEEKINLIDAQSQQLSAMIIQKAFRRIQKKNLCKLYLEQLTDKTNTLNKYLNQIHEIKNENQKQQDQSLYQAELAIHLQEQIEQLTEDKKQLNNSCSDKVQIINQFEKEINRLQIEKESDQQQMKFYIEKISELNSEIKSKDDQLAQCYEQLSDLSMKLRECTTSIEDLQSSIKTIKSQSVHDNIDYKVRKIQLTFQKHILRKELNNLLNNNEEFQSNIDDLIQKNSILQFQNEELQIQNKQLQDQVQDEENRIVELDLELREKNSCIEKISQMIEKREKNLSEFEKKVLNLEQLQKENQIIINQQYKQLEDSNFKLKIMRSIIIITKFITHKKYQNTIQSLLKAFSTRKSVMNDEIKIYQERVAGYQIARLLKQKVLEQKVGYYGRIIEERQNTVEFLQSQVDKEQYIFRKSSQVYEREVSARKIQSAYRLFKVNQIICTYKLKLDNLRRINFDYKEKIDRLQEQLYDLEDEIEKEKNVINQHNEQFFNEKGILQENINLLNTEFKKVINQREDREDQIQSLQKSEKTLKQRLKELDQKWREQYTLLEKKHIEVQKEKSILTESYDQTLAIITKDKALLIEYQNQLELSRQQDKAARQIQNFIKERKRKYESELLKKEKEDLSKIFKQKNAQTGQYLFQQSLKNVNQIFSNLIQNFTSNNNQ